MKRFKYSLQKILDLRHFQLKQAEMDLGRVNAQIAIVQNKLKDVANDRVRLARKVDEEKNDIIFYESAQSYFALLNQKKERLLVELSQLELIAEQKKEVVRQAMQKEKVLTRLKENKVEYWKDENQKTEELIVDDVVTAKYNKKSSKLV